MTRQQIVEGATAHNGRQGSLPAIQATGGARRERPGESQPGQLSPLLVWAVVFCDIGTSVYYVPGILYS